VSVSSEQARARKAQRTAVQTIFYRPFPRVEVVIVGARRTISPIRQSPIIATSENTWKSISHCRCAR